MTSEEMKNEVLSRAAALDKARNRRIKTVTATAVCAVIICAAVIPVFRTGKPGTASPSAQTTVSNAGTTTAGNADETTVRVTISAPAGQTGQTAGSSSSSSGSPSSGTSEKNVYPPNTAVSDGQTTRKNEPSTKPNESTTKVNEPSTKVNESTTKPSEPTTKANVLTTRKHAPVDNRPDEPNRPDHEATTRANHDITMPNWDSNLSGSGWLMENNKAGAANYQTVTKVINRDWIYYVKSVNYNGDNRAFKFSPNGVPVFGWIVFEDKGYMFYAESYSPITPDGEYIGTMSDVDTSITCMDGYKLYRFSGIKGESQPMILASNGERSLVFIQDQYS